MNMQNALLKIDTVSVALSKKVNIEPLIVVLSTKTNILIRFFSLNNLYEKVIQKLNLEEEGWGMNKGLASLECVGFRPEI